MAKIYPFLGLRYNLKKIKSLNRVICPPYDIILPEEQKYYYHLHPANIIRLELPQGKSPTKYEKAKKIYQDWLRRKILVQEEKPTFYLYQQDFIYPVISSPLSGKKFSRTGFFAVLELTPWGKSIHRHEKTFLKPKLDRLQLLSHLKANISPIFVLFSDKEKKIASLLAQEKRKKPITQFTDSDGMKHQIWQITDKEKISLLQRVLASKNLYIADGHHRYETALAYFHEQPLANSHQPSAKILTYLCPLEEEGLLMLPTYRVIKGKWSDDSRTPNKTLEEVGGRKWEKWKKEKEKYFSFTLLKDKKEMFLQLEENIALYFRDKYYLLKLKNEGKEVIKDLLPQSSLTYRQLPVAILHQFFLKDVEKEDLIYTQNAEEAIKLVNKGKGKIVFFYSSPKANILKTFAQTGEIMPEKSTYFYPKVPTGLVIYSLENTGIN
ncbi:MAG TPA: hypothetical protein DHV62_01525 [Elusimicrobia bacterium]|jgi:uncharacterized protein (DUF1015 family)|nr:hypothetical protein [Elusimicrobiota bacterium]